MTKKTDNLQKVLIGVVIVLLILVFILYLNARGIALGFPSFGGGDGGTSPEVSCEDPYILYKGNCCLDENYNWDCDANEPEPGSVSETGGMNVVCSTAADCRDSVCDTSSNDPKLWKCVKNTAPTQYCGDGVCDPQTENFNRCPKDCDNGR